MLKTQREIVITNDCGAIFNESELVIYYVLYGGKS